jgi:hypothetical protein
MLRKYMLYAAEFALLAVCLFACEIINGPNFPDKPKIFFRDIRKFRITDPLGNSNDSISVALKFQDGDGDLGIAAEEIGQPPFEKDIQNPDGSTSPNPRYFNYHVRGFRQVNGEWVEEEFIPTLSGQFPILNTGKEGPIEGTLYYGIRFPLTPSSPANITYRFEIFIYDRAGNRSDPVTTEPVIINQK